MTKRRFILRKIVDAETAAEALLMDSTTPVHEVFMDEKQPNGRVADAIGFQYTEEPGWYNGEPQNKHA